MAMVAMASCTRAFVTCTPCRRRAASSTSSSSSQGSSPNKTDHFTCCAMERNPSRSTSARILTSPPCPPISTNPRFCLINRNSVCDAVEGNSTSNSTTANAELPSSDKELDADIGEVTAEIEEQEIPAKASSQIRQERVVSGGESPSKIEEFWRGVLEETRLIEWPSLQKVLGTTGVVTSIIVGASLVLLTVNALLAQLSDAVFKNAPPA